MTDTDRFSNGTEAAARAAAIASYAIMDTPPERTFDDIAGLAAHVCGTPIAMVTLIDGARQWFKARIGLDVAETDLASCVCLDTLASDGTRCVPDLSRNAATRDLWYVAGPPKLRFYAGARIVNADGVAFGSVCVLDPRARRKGLGAVQAGHLEGLARQAGALIEARAMERRQAAEAAAREEASRRIAATLALGDALRGCEDSAFVRRETLRVIGETLGCRRVGYAAIDQGRTLGTIDAEWRLDGVDSIRGSYRTASGWAPLLDGLEEGGAVHIADLARHPWTACKAAFWERAKLVSATFCPTFAAGRLDGFLFMHKPPEAAWCAAEIDFVRDVALRMCDALARVEALERERLNAGELKHRLKNVFAMVLSIADHSLRASPTKEAGSRAIQERIHALSRAQDLLTDDYAGGAPLDEIVAEALRPFACGSIRIEGCGVLVGPRAATSFAMVLHELATNATKHGALSSPSGRVDVGWSLTGSDREAALDFVWRESGGPPVAPPGRRGFGTRVIASGFGSSARVEQRFEADGAVCRITAGCDALRI